MHKSYDVLIYDSSHMSFNSSSQIWLFGDSMLNFEHGYTLFSYNNPAERAPPQSKIIDWEWMSKSRNDGRIFLSTYFFFLDENSIHMWHVALIAVLHIEPWWGWVCENFFTPITHCKNGFEPLTVKFFKITPHSVKPNPCPYLLPWVKNWNWLWCHFQPYVTIAYKNQANNSNSLLF